MNENRKRKRRVVAGSSFGFGSMLAIVMSWTANKSLFWVLVHGLLSWLYVIYYLATHNDWTVF